MQSLLQTSRKYYVIFSFLYQIFFLTNKYTFSYVFILYSFSSLFTFTELCQTEFYLTVSFFAITHPRSQRVYTHTYTLIPAAFPPFETKFFHVGFYPPRPNVVALCDDTRLSSSTIERKIRFGAISGSGLERGLIRYQAGREKRRTCELR